MKLDVLLAVPPKYQEGLDLEEVAKVFPYGDVRFELQGECIALNIFEYFFCLWYHIME